MVQVPLLFTPYKVRVLEEDALIFEVFTPTVNPDVSLYNQ